MEINTCRLVLFEELLKYYTEEQLQKLCDNARRRKEREDRILCTDSIEASSLMVSKANIVYRSTKDPDVYVVLKNRYGPTGLMWKADLRVFMEKDVGQLLEDVFGPRR